MARKTGRQNSQQQQTKIRKEITQSCPMQQGEIKIRKRRVCFFVGALREFLNRDHLQVGRESEQEVVPF